MSGAVYLLSQYWRDINFSPLELVAGIVLAVVIFAMVDGYTRG